MPESDGAEKALTAKQSRWVDEFLLDQNGTQAAIRAGFSRSCARNVAWLFRHDAQYRHVRAALDRAMADEARANRALRARLREELCAIAFSRVPRLVDGDDLATDLDEADQAAIMQVSISKFQDEGRTLKLRPWNKLQAQALLLKHFAMPERSQGADDITRAIDEVEDRFNEYDRQLDALVEAVATEGDE